MAKDIIIDMKLENGGFIADLEKTKARLNAVAVTTQKNLQKMRPAMNGFFTPFSVGMNNTTKQLEHFSKTVDRKVTPAIHRTGRAVRNIPFQAWALSIMFFGMAIQRVFTQIWKAAQTTFNDVAHSVEGTVTGFDLLSGSMTYLKFVAGEALEPIAFMLGPIVDVIAEWIEDNKSLFRTLVVVAGVVGTILFVVGTLVLGILGLVTAFDKVLMVIGLVKAAWYAFSFGFGALLLPEIAAILAAVALLWLVWKFNLGNIQTYFKETFGILLTTVKSVFKSIMGIFDGLFKILKGLFTGDLDLILDGMKQVIVNLIAGVVKIFMGLGAAVINVFILIKNIVSDIFFNILSLIVQTVVKIIELMNKIPGVDISTNGLEGVVETLRKVKENNRDDYITRDGIAEKFEAIDSFLGIGEAKDKTAGQTINNVNIEISADADISKTEEMARQILEGMEANQ